MQHLPMPPSREMRPANPYDELSFFPSASTARDWHMAVSPFGLAGGSVHAYSSREEGLMMSVPTPEADGFTMILHRMAFDATPVWSGKKFYEIRPRQTGDFTLSDNRVSRVAECPGVCDTLHLVLPHAAFNRGRGKRGSPSWRMRSDSAVADPTLRYLIQSLHPALLDETKRETLFTDTVIEAATIHISKFYELYSSTPFHYGGRLTPWQEKTAKELLASRLNGDTTMSEIATACGLSVDYFSACFKRTTGLSPYRWFSQYRVEQAKRMLVGTNLPLADVALTCGYADQSHFTGSFSKEAGLSPGEWRRQGRQ